MITWNKENRHIYYFYSGDLRVSIVGDSEKDSDPPTWDNTALFVGRGQDEAFLMEDLKASTLKEAKAAAVKKLREWLQTNLHALGPDLEVS